MQLIDEFLALKRMAFVGVSHNEHDFSRKLFRELLVRGYDVVPVNPNALHIEGQRCFARVQDIAPSVEGALLMTSQLVTRAVVRDCAEAGIHRIWMYGGGGKGAVSPEALSFCESAGMSVIPGECPFMFLSGAGWIHRIHGVVMKIAGAYPH